MIPAGESGPFSLHYPDPCIHPIYNGDQCITLRGLPDGLTAFAHTLPTQATYHEPLPASLIIPLASKNSALHTRPPTLDPPHSAPHTTHSGNVLGCLCDLPRHSLVRHRHGQHVWGHAWSFEGVDQDVWPEGLIQCLFATLCHTINNWHVNAISSVCRCVLLNRMASRISLHHMCP